MTATEKPPKTWREYVARITFGFPIKTLLSVEIDEVYDAERLLVTFVGLPDVYKPGEVTNVYGCEFLPPFEDAAMVGECADIVRDAILRQLAHEVDERLRFDGKQLRDPHANDPKL